MVEQRDSAAAKVGVRATIQLVDLAGASCELTTLIRLYTIYITLRKTKGLYLAIFIALTRL